MNFSFQIVCKNAFWSHFMKTSPFASSSTELSVGRFSWLKLCQVPSKERHKCHKWHGPQALVCKDLMVKERTNSVFLLQSFCSVLVLVNHKMIPNVRYLPGVTDSKPLSKNRKTEEEGRAHQLLEGLWVPVLQTTTGKSLVLSPLWAFILTSQALSTRDSGRLTWAEHFLTLALLMINELSHSWVEATLHPITEHERGIMIGRQPPSIPCHSRNAGQLFKTSWISTPCRMHW